MQSLWILKEIKWITHKTHSANIPITTVITGEGWICSIPKIKVLELTLKFEEFQYKANGKIKIPISTHHLSLLVELRGETISWQSLEKLSQNTGRMLLNDGDKLWEMHHEAILLCEHWRVYLHTPRWYSLLHTLAIYREGLWSLSVIDQIVTELWSNVVIEL